MMQLAHLRETIRVIDTRMNSVQAAGHDDTLVGKPEPFALHYELSQRAVSPKPRKHCGDLDDQLFYAEEIARNHPAPAAPIDRQRALDALQAMKHHRARVAAQREHTCLKLTALDAALAELDPLISIWEGIVQHK